MNFLYFKLEFLNEIMSMKKFKSRNMKAISKNIGFFAISEEKLNSNGNKIKIHKINKKLEILWILSRVEKNEPRMN